MTLLLPILAAALIAQASRPSATDPFPAATPESQGLDAAKLEELAGIVKRLAESEEIVGGELLVIRNDRTVLSRAFGWKDRESKTRLEPGAIFCLRSMTKPVVGTAVEMLIDEGKLALADRVSKHLVSFDNDASRAITIDQLLSHRGGLPLSGLLGRDPSTVTGVREVADAAGERGPSFPPGEGFHYSDDGADTLGALVEVAGGKPLAELLTERIFAPLDLRDVIPVVAVGHPLRPKIASNYVGSKGSWSRYWSNADKPIFLALLASQGLYGSARDYARFLALWKAKGKVGAKRLLSASAVQRGLEPVVSMSYPTTFEGLETEYGRTWMLWCDAKRRVVAFGHGGSDGTHAWVWPDLDLMVLYFTQSRGNTTGIDLEKSIQRLVVDPLAGTKRAGPAAYSAAELDALAGLYRSDTDGALVRIVARDGKLSADFVAIATLDLEATPQRDHWTIALVAGQTLEAERDRAEKAVAMIARRTKETERYARFAPDPQWPSVDEVMALRKKANDWDKIAALGALRIAGTISMPALKRSGTIEATVLGLSKLRQKIGIPESPSVMGLDGDRARVARGDTEPTDADPELAEGLHLEHALAPISDWRPLYRELRVVSRETREKGGTSILLLAVSPRGMSSILEVDADSGLLREERKTANVAGLGRVPVTRRFDDWRDVGGVKLPFLVKAEFAVPMLGTIEVKRTAIEPCAAPPAGAFTLEDLKKKQ